MSNSKLKTITDFLDLQDIHYTLIHHLDARTCDESHRARAELGFANATGAKAILMKMEMRSGGFEYNTFVIPSHLRLNSKRLKQIMPQIKSFRFATLNEFTILTDGLLPGSLPPFTKPFFQNLTNLYIDEQLLDCDPIAFNVASLGQSIIMSCKDYMQAANPSSVFSFSC